MTIANRYNLLKQLGEGGFGEVWLAEDTMTSTQVALKLYKVNSRGHDELVREYRLVAGLKHPNLLTASYVGRDDEQGISFLEMDYCRYGSLENKIGSLTEKQIWQCIRDVSAGLQALATHTVFDENLGREISAPVVHQDIKPANILIRNCKENVEMTFSIADFGISKMNISQKSGSTLFSSAGTLSYMAPERFKPDYQPIVESDIWSLGAMLFEIVEGRLPFASMEGLSGGNWLNQKGIDIPKLENAKVALQLRDLIYSCMARELEKRPTAMQLFETSNEVLTQGTHKVQTETKTVSGETVSMAYTGNAPLASQPHPNQVPKPALKPTIEPVAKPSFRPTHKHIWIFIAAVSIAALIFVALWTKSDDKYTEVLLNDNTLKFAIEGTEYDYQMVYVDGGSYTMGCGSEQDAYCFGDEKPAHNVSVSSFYIGQTEVTQALWKAVMGNNPSFHKGNLLPVESVSYSDCKEFIKKLNKLTNRKFRLPTEAEWEFAARGGNFSQGYKFSGGDNLNSVAWYTDNSGNNTHNVAQKQPNELGLYDMTGNVWEWCEDRYGHDYYNDSPHNNPKGPKWGSLRVLRGCCAGAVEDFCYVQHRAHVDPSVGSTDIGLRIALDP